MSEANDSIIREVRRRQAEDVREILIEEETEHVENNLIIQLRMHEYSTLSLQMNLNELEVLVEKAQAYLKEHGRG